MVKCDLQAGVVVWDALPKHVCNFIGFFCHMSPDQCGLTFQAERPTLNMSRDWDFAPSFFWHLNPLHSSVELRLKSLALKTEIS